MSDDRLRGLADPVRSRDAAKLDIAVKALQNTLALLENMPIKIVAKAYITVRAALDSIETIGAGP